MSLVRILVVLDTAGSMHLEAAGPNVEILGALDLAKAIVVKRTIGPEADAPGVPTKISAALPVRRVGSLGP